jgi:bifunctional DNA-binding transcriptional regulator/antitoxin component of YhaV-PrlF toxin-antitoxin module
MEPYMGVQYPIETVISATGQVTLPKAIRDKHFWSAGTRLTVEVTLCGVLLKALPVFPETTIEAVFGSLRHSGLALSLEDMQAAIDREAESRARESVGTVGLPPLIPWPS